MEKNDPAIHILDDYHECLGRTVDFLVPAKIGDDRKIDSQKRADDGLHLSLKPGRRQVSIDTLEIDRNHVLKL